MQEVKNYSENAETQKMQWLSAEEVIDEKLQKQRETIDVKLKQTVKRENT